jgi:hypothetical protein
MTRAEYGMLTWMKCKLELRCEVEMKREKGEDKVEIVPYDAIKFFLQWQYLANREKALLNCRFERNSKFEAKMEKCRD